MKAHEGTCGCGECLGYETAHDDYAPHIAAGNERIQALTAQLSRLTSDDFINGLAEKIARGLYEAFWIEARQTHHRTLKQDIASIIKSAINEGGK